MKGGLFNETYATKPFAHPRLGAIKPGDRIENYRVGRIYVVTAVGCYHGDEIAFNELVVSARAVPGAPCDVVLRKRLMTFKQFARLKFLRREGDRA